MCMKKKYLVSRFIIYNPLRVAKEESDEEKKHQQLLMQSRFMPSQSDEASDESMVVRLASEKS